MQRLGIDDRSMATLSNLDPKKVNRMGSSNKSKRRALPANYVYKTAGDFMRWRKAQEALKKQLQRIRSFSSDRATSQALMASEEMAVQPEKVT